MFSPDKDIQLSVKAMTLLQPRKDSNGSSCIFITNTTTRSGADW